MSVYCKLVRALAVVILATSHVASQAPPELSSTLYSTISGASVAFSNENITFTCIVRGSNQMEWRSDEYIGGGGRSLIFISSNMPGYTDSAGETVGEVIRAIRNEVIESRLYIRIRSSITNASVQCRDSGTGAIASINFRLADNDISAICDLRDRQSVCPGEAVTCVCATGNSNTLAWAINENRLEFPSNDALMTMRGINAIGILTNISSENRVEVITSNLTVTASTDDTSLQIQCRNVDRSTSNLTTIPVSQNDCPEVTTPSVTAEPAPNPGGSVGLRAAVGVLVVACVILIALIGIIAALIELKARRKLSVLQKKCDDKEEEVNVWKGKAKDWEDKANDWEDKANDWEEKANGWEQTANEKNRQIIQKEEDLRQLRATNKNLNERIRQNDVQIAKLSSANSTLVTEKDGIIRGLQEKNRELVTEKDGIIRGLQGRNRELERNIEQRDRQIQNLREQNH